MSTVRQMPGLYLRGSLANVTMANLTASQQAHVNQLINHISDHPSMIGHRTEFMKALGSTIRADYFDDRKAAEEEYHIAIWRGVVDLFYHRPYEFRCQACGSNSYLTKRQKPAAINRQSPQCPNCHKVKVGDPGDTNLQAGEFIEYEAFQDAYRHLGDGQRQPVSESPIAYIAGPGKYDNPQQVVDDPHQLAKFFGEFVWNYLRQQLNENVRKEHKKSPQRIVGPADTILVQEILALCARLKVDYNYCPELNPERGYYKISLATLQSPPEFSSEFCELLYKAKTAGVGIVINIGDIQVQAVANAPILEAFVVKPEHVLILDSYARISDGSDGEHPINQITYRTVGEERMDQEDHVASVENKDVLTAVREALPNIGLYREVFDICSGNGDIYHHYSDGIGDRPGYGDGSPKVAHIAEFLSTTTRTVNQCKQMIGHLMMEKGLVPEGLVT